MRLQLARVASLFELCVQCMCLCCCCAVLCVSPFSLLAYCLLSSSSNSSSATTTATASCYCSYSRLVGRHRVPPLDADRNAAGARGPFAAASARRHGELRSMFRQRHRWEGGLTRRRGRWKDRCCRCCCAQAATVFLARCVCIAFLRFARSSQSLQPVLERRRGFFMRPPRTIISPD